MNSHLIEVCRRRSLVTLGIVVFVAAALSACGKTASTVSSSASTGSAGTSTAHSSTATAAASGVAGTSGCGSVPTVPFNDQSGLISTLGTRYQTAYNGYATPIFKSAWSQFKPSHHAPYAIGVSVTQPINSFQGQLAAMLAAHLHAIPGVGKVTVLTSPPIGLTTQLQQVNQLIEQKVDVLVVEPLVAQAFAGVAERAAKAGIPFVSVLNSTPAPVSVNVAPNTVADALAGAAAVARMIHGTGTVIGVHGIPSTAGDQQAFAGYARALRLCPKITFVPSLVGEYQIPVAKQQVLAYLTSHPQPVAGALETAEMAPAILQAFQQTGRPEPAIDIAGPSLGDLAYWSAHKGTLKAVGGTIPAGDMARAVSYTVAHLLTGHGPKISEISSPSPVITDANLAQWAKPGVSVDDAAAVEGPGNAWLPDSYLAPLFNK
jgi:ribose transport system substrate-binding protein